MSQSLRGTSNHFRECQCGSTSNTLKELKVHERNDGLCTGFHVRKELSSEYLCVLTKYGDGHVHIIKLLCSEIFLSPCNSNDPCGLRSCSIFVAAFVFQSSSSVRHAHSDLRLVETFQKWRQTRVNKSRIDHNAFADTYLCSSAARLSIRRVSTILEISNTTYSTLRRLGCSGIISRKFTGLKRHDQIHRFVASAPKHCGQTPQSV